MMKAFNQQHTSYILRVWRSEQANEHRFILVDVLTGENWHFADINGLNGFLSAVTNFGAPVAPFIEENHIRSFVE